MKRSSRLWSLVVPVFMLLLSTASFAYAQQEPSIGKVTALEGRATVLRQGRFAPEPMAAQTRIFEGDIIQTEVASKVRITLIDDTVISLGEQSRLEMRQFAYVSGQQTRTARFAIPTGFFRAIVKTIFPQSSIEVITPTAIAAIRGTDLMGEVTADSAAIVVIEGSVVISDVRPLFRGLTTLTQGMGVTMAASQPPPTPTRWSESRIEALRRATTVP
jgi:hypothetical protein